MAEAASQERIAVIGLGYVGLPLAVALARAQPPEGPPVTGFDIDPRRLEELGRGHDRTGELAIADLAAAGLRLTGVAEDLAGSSVYIVTVPTPVDEASRPDLGPLRAACASVGRALALAPRPGVPRAAQPIVVFESTVYPGVTEDVCGPALEAASGLAAGRDFLLGYSPERINPGDRQHTIDRIVKVVAGQTPAATERLAALYGGITRAGTAIARDIRTAEAAKVIENAQRDINIAFINEVAMIFGRLGLSVYDVLEAARTKWNFLDFRPGLVGGHCIGVDPFYLAHCAQALGHEPEIILAGRRINDGMGDYIAGRIAGAAGAAQRHRTLVLGLTFKENLPDLRNSKVVDLVRGLTRRGHQVAVHDPWADADEARRHYGIELLAPGEPLPPPGAYDCLVAAVAHDRYRALSPSELGGLLRPGGLIADIKGIWRDLPLADGRRRWEL
ncbi:MAG: nucleotide sugar dehydrogenase [Dongiaceae bacterium]